MNSDIFKLARNHLIILGILAHFRHFLLILKDLETNRTNLFHK